MTKNRNQDQTVLENDLLEFINKRFLDRILINGKKPSIREIERETNIGRSTVNKILKKMVMIYQFQQLTRFAHMPIYL